MAAHLMLLTKLKEIFLLNNDSTAVESTANHHLRHYFALIDIQRVTILSQCLT